MAGANEAGATSLTGRESRCAWPVRPDRRPLPPPARYPPAGEETMSFSPQKTPPNGLVRSARRTSLRRLETLEDRCVPATFLVNTVADTMDASSAVTSLREAITDAN